MKAQMARGADFESGNILRRAKALIPILVPLFISAFRIAQDLAMAMEARCYGRQQQKDTHEWHEDLFERYRSMPDICRIFSMIILERILL